MFPTWFFNTSIKFLLLQKNIWVFERLCLKSVLFLFIQLATQSREHMAKRLSEADITMYNTCNVFASNKLSDTDSF